jgi:hypothetical protein
MAPDVERLLQQLYGDLLHTANPQKVAEPNVTTPHNSTSKSAVSPPYLRTVWRARASLNGTRLERNENRED